jgi:hypothetical protein
LVSGARLPLESSGVGFSCREGADLDEVVGEYAVSAPGSGSVDAGEFGSVPPVASFDVVDSSGPPFDLLAEGSVASIKVVYESDLIIGTGVSQPSDWRSSRDSSRDPQKSLGHKESTR